MKMHTSNSIHHGGYRANELIREQMSYNWELRWSSRVRVDRYNLNDHVKLILEIWKTQ